MTMDDSRSATLNEEKSSFPPSRDEEKTNVTSLNDSEAGVPVPLAVVDQPTHHYQKDLDASEAGRLELKQIKTSETGIEYPNGTKLALITLAICLSVFLMALVWQP
jgi:hypothetical protein